MPFVFSRLIGIWENNGIVSRTNRAVTKLGVKSAIILRVLFCPTWANYGLIEPVNSAAIYCLILNCFKLRHYIPHEFAYFSEKKFESKY